MGGLRTLRASSNWKLDELASLATTINRLVWDITDFEFDLGTSLCRIWGEMDSDSILV